MLSRVGLFLTPWTEDDGAHDRAKVMGMMEMMGMMGMMGMAMGMVLLLLLVAVGIAVMMTW